eukprot:3140995-Pleurochrysis_carterae.AAC.8
MFRRSTFQVNFGESLGPNDHRRRFFTSLSACAPAFCRRRALSHSSALSSARALTRSSAHALEVLACSRVRTVPSYGRVEQALAP